MDPSVGQRRAVSRAIRTPSRVDRNLVFPGILVVGTFESEKLTAIEGIAARYPVLAGHQQAIEHYAASSRPRSSKLATLGSSGDPLGAVWQTCGLRFDGSAAREADAPDSNDPILIVKSIFSECCERTFIQV